MPVFSFGNVMAGQFLTVLFCIALNFDKFLTLMKVKTILLSFRLTEILHYICTTIRLYL